jgi:hypothetical protein
MSVAEWADEMDDSHVQCEFCRMFVEKKLAFYYHGCQKKARARAIGKKVRAAKIAAGESVSEESTDESAVEEENEIEPEFSVSIFFKFLSTINTIVPALSTQQCENSSFGSIIDVNHTFILV